MVGMVIFSLSLFAREFLRLRRFAPLMAKILLVTMAGGIIVALAGIVLPYRVGVQLGVVVNFIAIALVVFSGALVWKRGNSSARYFFIAVSFFLSGNIIFVLKTIGFLPSNAFTNHIVEIGLAIEGLLFAFALAERYRQFRIEKEEAQQEALRIEQVAKTELEGKVQERTNELAKTNDEMQRQMVILNDQAIEIEMTNVELQEKNLLLEGLNREKNEFLGVAAHDLKNPLQTIIMNTSMIRRYAERMSDEQRDELLDRVEETSRRMHDIIEKLLDANAIESGTIELKSESVALVREVRSLVQDYMPKAAAKNITLHFEVQNENLCALADKNRAIQVVENLLSNAIKFSPLGKNVYVRMTNDELPTSHKPALCLAIQDEGPGLSDDDKEKLFGKFARLSARPTGGEHSTGLGLSIVKKLIEAMHGEIWCDSELGKGATFAFRLPSADSNT
jgi:signal transduction histidine kinase